jgi:uncharacterized membrane protein YeiH
LLVVLLLSVTDAPVFGAWPLIGLDLAGVFVFALSGGLAAVRKRFDLLGVLVLALAAGLGGGMLRDVLIGDLPPVGLSDWRLLAAALTAGVLTFLFHPGIARIGRLVGLLDGLGLGLFAVAGTLKALQLGVDPLPAVMVGVLTAVGGGVLRDLLSGEVPRVLTDRELYAVPALVGAALYATAWSAGATQEVVAWGCVALIAGVRLMAMRWGWKVPAAR